MERITQALETARLELLDMGLRGNSLLHFRPGAKTVEVVDERATEILRILVEEKRTLSFIPLPGKLAEDSTSLGMPELVTRLAELQGDKRHQDNRLQTRLTAEQLDKRLLKIHTDANTFIQEQGINILYLALGFLTWFETNTPEIPRQAPLLLVPVSLTRSSVRERFALRYTEAELGGNLTLAAKLKTEFHIDLPEFTEETVLAEYWKHLQEQVASKNGWAVNADDIALGFFSFGKFQMYQDLAPDIWPADRHPASHPTLQALLHSGFSGSGAPGSPSPSPFHDSLNFIKDADSSQTAAVLAVKEGGHLVIQGPPGTGKSQTITNIIAESLATGKTILFVAEKMAALDVVKRRLEECHLGAAVLALHSHKTNKRSVLEDLQNTLELGAPQVGDHTEERQRHRQLQQQLDEYCVAVNTPILQSGYAFIDALGLYHQATVALADAALPPLDCPDWPQWNASRFGELDRTVGELAALITTMGTPLQHPFADSGLQDCSPMLAEEVRASLVALTPLLADQLAQAATLANALNAEKPTTLAEWEGLIDGANLLIQRPPLTGLNVTAAEWHSQQALLRELMTWREEMLTIRHRRKNELMDQGWHVDVREVRRIWAALGDRWWRVLAADFRRARRTLRGILKGCLPQDRRACLELLDDLLRWQTLDKQATSHTELIHKLFGSRWAAEPALRDESEWLMALHHKRAEGQISDAVMQRIADGGPPAIQVAQLDQLRKQTAVLSERLLQLAQLLELRQNPRHQSLTRLQHAYTTQSGHLEQLYEMARYNRLSTDLMQSGLTALVAQAWDGTLAPGQMQYHLSHTWYRNLLNHAYSQSEALRFFDRQRHESAIQEFRKLDVAIFRQAQERLVAQHFQQLPNGNAGEMEVLRREINKKRRHLPIRQLLAQAGRAVQKIKPVFMMSPMSVATYLQPGDLSFDLVIFDEASQVRVVDAFGPLLRARQAVVVGDTRQMPPTDFFSKSLELDEEEAEISTTADIESILSMFLAKGAPEAWLRWHYRSRHESLIQLSNQAFYDNKLFIFPSPGLNPLARGLLFHHLPNTAYQRGTSRTNPGEARAVAEAVMRHAEETPNLTLGVVAFSTAQRDCILQELENLRQADNRYEAFFDENQLEGFFVKNLENVQGDERDVIMISIGYGRTTEGNVSRHFGPINNEGGQRRLNVLITRARLAMEVFCNFTADDLTLPADAPLGVRALREFLHYAANRQQTDQQAAATAAGHFESVVTALLEAHGYKVRPQLGTAGFYLDIALADPHQPGCYRLAVECDGSNYYRNPTARDRDRLRQQVLEGLGWDFYRIWSVDWYRQPQQEAHRLLERVTQAMAAPTAVPPPKSTTKHNREIRRDESGVADGGNVLAYHIFDGKLSIGGDTDLASLTPQKLAPMLQKILVHEGPLHLREAARRVAGAAGISRVTNRLLQQLTEAAQEGHQQRYFHFADDFIYADERRQVTPRNRAGLPVSSRQWELVPPEEWQAAILQVMANAFTVSPEELASHTLTLLGFARPSAQIKSQVQNTVTELIARHVLKLQSGKISRA
jgi:very-short-patch-repair endonuclease/DNA polymerase III delta prime subunit